ncbi:MAG: hypothetical protein BRD46_02655 [Bacteroidetes bacterium QS_8_68_15]|nr:MAG: hypothetical protein BRD46_02655 [Bacteroidetes bacterium QS_8_68_15]
MPSQTKAPPPAKKKQQQPIAEQPPLADSRARTHRFTREQYEQMIEAGVLTPEDRCELLGGQIVDKMPQSSRHFTIISLVDEALCAAYPENEYTVRVQGPLAVHDDSEPEPDVAVVQGRPRDYVDAHPTTALLVVEVSDTSLRRDRTRKERIYARTGIAAYWVVNLDDESLEVYRDPNGDGYDRRETLRPPDATLRPPQADADVAVADLLP